MQVAAVSKYYVAYKTFIRLSHSINYKYKPLCKNLLKIKSGRNNSGKITMRHRGGGLATHYKAICLNYNQLKHDIIISWIVLRLEYDSNRSSNIALIGSNYFTNMNYNFIKPIAMFNNYYTYILAGETLKRGDILNFFNEKLQNAPSKHQWCILEKIPTGSVIFNLAQKKKNLGVLARSAGTKCKLLRKYKKHGLIVLPSKKTKRISLQNYGTIGVVSNSEHKLRKLYKAGNSRWKGKRPKVRGVAKNPVDHPHGGGEGKSSGGRHSVSAWGILTKGFVTIRKKKKKKKKKNV